MYLVREAFVLNSASYQLISTTDSAIELSLPALSDFLETETNVGYSVSSDGLLTVEQPVVVAVRQAIRLGDVFSSPALLPDGPPLDDPTANIRSADAALDAWYLKSIQE